LIIICHPRIYIAAQRLSPVSLESGQIRALPLFAMVDILNEIGVDYVTYVLEIMKPIYPTML
jgi:hypothetical protein